jgi:outer membrane autotransporter protein
MTSTLLGALAALRGEYRPDIRIHGTITGGDGGDGGANGGVGGNGGAGIIVAVPQGVTDPSTVWLNIDGTVKGGNGGGAGSNGGLAGLGGVGVEGSSLFITMYDGGSITGGMGGTPLTQANAINFTGGSNTVLFTGATSQLSGNINVAQGASVVLGSFPGTEVDNVITGGGSIWVGGSDIALTGANTYSGGTVVFDGGMLKLSGAGTLGDASGCTNIYWDSIVDLGGTTQTQGTVHLGGFRGGGTIRNGNLNASIISIGGTIEDIGGAASLTTNAGTTTMLGNNSYSGATVVDGGRLNVQGAITGTSSVNMNSWGILGGNGVINAPVVRINDGGIIAPGNSIGTLTINGALTLAAGSTYQVEIAGDGTADRIDVSGKATVDGSHVAVTALDPEASYKTGQTYRILTAGGGVVGTFAEAATESVFLDLALVHTANAVDLKIRLKNAGPVFGTVAETRNQVATADALDGLQQSGPQLALYNSLLMLNAEQARASFDQLSGDVHASAKGVMIEDSRFARDAAMDRLRDAFDAVGAVRSPVTTYVDGKPVSAAASTDGFAFWGRGFGSWGQWDGDGNAAAIKRDTSGFFAGGDGIVGDSWRVGVLGGYSRSTFNARDRYAAGSSDNYHVGLYGGTQWGDLAFRSGAAYTWHKVATDRVVAFPGFVDSLNADYNARTAQAFGELGYGIQAGGVAFEPFANLAYVSLATDGLGEKGGAAALTSASSTTNATFTTLGARAATSFSLGATTATAKGTLGWRHAYGGVSPASQIRFAGGDAFSIAGVPIARNVGVVEAGLDFALSPSAVLGVSYGGQFGSGLSDQSVKVNFNVKF